MNFYEYHLLNIDDERVHYPYDMEKELLDAISRGDDTTAIHTVSQLLFGNQYDVGTFAAKRLKQTEYLTVITIGLLCRAVIAGGVPPQISYDQSDLLLLQLSQLETIEQYTDFLFYIIKVYCNLVTSHNRNLHATPHVRRRKAFIYNNLTRRFSVKDLAAELHISPNYLSAIFCKEEGVSIKKFIRRERISLAKDLLHRSNQPISEIASIFCFSSAAHFCRVFREETGQTPLEYRNHRIID